MKLSGLISVLLVAACKQTADGVADILVVAKVEVSPASATLVPRETVQLDATPRTEGGLALPNRDVVWFSRAPGIATVSSTGLVTAVAAGGPVTISAMLEDVEGQALIMVNPLPVGRVSVSPPQANLRLGSSLQLTATAYDAGGNVLSGQSFFWESGAPQIASVSSTGLVTAQALGGPIVVTATSGGKSSGSAITVTTQGAASRLSITRQPAALAVAGVNFTQQPLLQLLDASGSQVKQSAVAVTAAIYTASALGTLGGTLTVTTNSNGVAAFTNLKISKAGSYTLKFTSPGLTPAISNTIVVN